MSEDDGDGSPTKKAKPTAKTERRGGIVKSNDESDPGSGNANGCKGKGSEQRAVLSAGQL